MRPRDLLVDGPNSIGARARAGRWEMFVEAFPQVADYTVLDLGGTTEYWRRSPVRPAHVTVVNLFEPGEGGDGVEPVVGDACDYRDDRSYDLVVSNSLLEHVGGHAHRARLAATIRACAPRHWIQTPYRYFPVEPHWVFPGMQFLPFASRVRLAQTWPLVHTRPADRAEAVEAVQWTELIGLSQMRDLFPDSHVFFERMAGLPKSLIAVRGAAERPA